MANFSTPNPRVIVVDDEPSVRYIVRRMLEPAGYRAEEAENPLRACAVAKTSGPLDLFVADLRMPELTGGEVARRFRAAQPDVKVLFITGFADDLFDECPRLWDGETPLEKPFNQKSLLEATALPLFGTIHGEPAAAGGA